MEQWSTLVVYTANESLLAFKLGLVIFETKQLEIIGIIILVIL